MKLFPKALRKAARDSVVGGIIGVVSFCLAMVFLYAFLWIVGYSYSAENYINTMVVVATITTAVMTTANAYRERKQRKNRHKK